MNSFVLQAKLPDCMEISPGEVHVWRLFSNRSEKDLSALSLSDDEIVRSKRFHFDKDRNRYIVCRRTLRRLLGLYLKKSPEEIRFQHGKYGKPFIYPCGSESLQFNLSHSGDLALIAVTVNKLIGVDIEKIRELSLDRIDRIDTIDRINAIVSRFFSRSENEYLDSVPEKQRRDEFYLLWTRKESVIKAWGGSLPVLSTKTIVLKPEGESNIILNAPASGLPVSELSFDRAQHNLEWTIIDLKPFPGYSGAVAVEGCTPVLSLFHLDTVKEIE